MKLRLVAFATILTLVLTSSLVAQSNPPAPESYSWSGELVRVEGTTLTVKTRVVGEQAIGEFPRLKGGERVLITWSGATDFADAISRVALEATSRSEERFTFPVEFVSYDNSTRYVTLKVKIPENGVSALSALKPGEWVTAMSPHGAVSKTTPVTRIRPYVGTWESTSSK
jgi:hypothetical protein